MVSEVTAITGAIASTPRGYGSTPLYYGSTPTYRGWGFSEQDVFSDTLVSGLIYSQAVKACPRLGQVNRSWSVLGAPGLEFQSWS